MLKTKAEVFYTSPRLEVLTHAVECGFQGTTAFVQGDSGENKSIADPDVVELDSW